MEYKLKVLRKLPLPLMLICVGLAGQMKAEITSITPKTFYVIDNPQDSIGQEMVSGTRVVLHKIEKGETLFGIARKYKASVAEIRKLNPDAGDALKLGQIVKIPRSVGTAPAVSKVEPAKEEKAIKPAEKVIPSPKEPAKVENEVKEPLVSVPPKRQLPAPPEQLPAVRYHTVGQGQTLSMIAKTYGVSVAEVQEWNNITGSNIRIGQTLAVSKPPVKQQAAAKANEKVEQAAPLKEIKPVAQSPVAETQKQEPNGKESISISTDGSKRVGPESGLEQIVERGMAEAISNEADGNKQMCLHRIAPVGSIVKVKNELNGMSIYARVIGKLPETGVNQKVAIRLSKSAMDKLYPAETKVPVVITYSAPSAQASSNK